MHDPGRYPTWTGSGPGTEFVHWRPRWVSIRGTDGVTRERVLTKYVQPGGHIISFADQCLTDVGRVNEYHVVAKALGISPLGAPLKKPSRVVR